MQADAFVALNDACVVSQLSSCSAACRMTHLGTGVQKVCHHGGDILLIIGLTPLIIDVHRSCPHDPHYTLFAQISPAQA